MVKERSGPKAEMKRHLRKINEELKSLLDSLSNFYNSAEKAGKKLEKDLSFEDLTAEIDQTSSTHRIAYEILQDFYAVQFEYITDYDSSEFYLNLDFSGCIYMENFIDLTDYLNYLHLKQKELSAIDFDKWKESFFSSISSTLSEKAIPIIMEVISILTSYTGYDFYFVGIKSISTIYQHLGDSLTSKVNFIIDFK